MTPTPVPVLMRQMRLPLASAEATGEVAPTAHATSQPRTARDRASCPRCRGTGTAMRMRRITDGCGNCGRARVYALTVGGADSSSHSLPRFCEWHACSFCGGTGFVCAVCHGTRWLRRPAFPVGNEAVRCEACDASGNNGKEASR